MSNPYCEKHEWSANHPLGRCRDCIELEKLKDALILMRHERDEARRNLDHYVGELGSTKLQLSDLKKQAALEGEGIAFLHEEVRELKASLRDVLEISEVEGAANLTTMESCKLIAARSMLGPESRFAQKRDASSGGKAPLPGAQGFFGQPSSDAFGGASREGESGGGYRS